MINMEPVLKRGYAEWNQSLLPKDEFASRMQAVREAMNEQGLKALILVNYSVLGGLYHYADMAYLTGMQSGGGFVIPDQGEPRLITFGGGRELSFTRTQTWVEDVTARGQQTFSAMRDVLRECNITSGPIAAVGVKSIPASRLGSFNDAFKDYQLKEFDETLYRMRVKKRDREILVTRVAQGIVTQALAAGQKVFADGGSNLDALLAAEEWARSEKARDVRLLANTDGEHLRPFENSPSDRHTPLVLWGAVQYQGYWAEAALTSPMTGGNEADKALSVMKAKARSGVKASDVAKAGLDSLSPSSQKSALMYGLGGTVGLGLGEGVVIHPSNDATLPDGALLSLRVFAGHSDGSAFSNVLLHISSKDAAPVEPASLDLV